MWGWLNKRNLEPSTPAKMMFGMFLVGVTFTLLYFVARAGESQDITPAMLTSGDFRVIDRSLGNLKAENVPDDVLEKLKKKDEKEKFIVEGQKLRKAEKYTGVEELTDDL